MSSSTINTANDPPGVHKTIVQVNNQDASKQPLPGESYTSNTGINFHVFCADITWLNVTGIVNASNENLQHTLGLAGTISEAAGPNLRTECEAIIKKAGGKLQAGQVVVTNGYNLNPCLKVIHVVGPSLGDSSAKLTYGKALERALEKCLNKAEELQFSSLAIPPLSSVSFGATPDTVADQILKVIIKFVSGRPQHLKDILFVDIGPSFIEKIQKRIRREIIYTQGREIQNVRSSYQRFKIHRSKYRTTTVHMTASSVPTERGHINSNGCSIPDSNQRHASLKQPTCSDFEESTSADAHGLQNITNYKDLNGIASPGAHANKVRCNANTHQSRFDETENQQSSSTIGKGSGASECCICMEAAENPKSLKCGHVFCRQCINTWFSSRPTCPSCGEIHGRITGNQPKGTIRVQHFRGMKLPGFDDAKGTIEIRYYFEDGLQGPEHPHPGRPYSGTSRTAYLPDNEEGNQVLALLRRAFDARLIFTIGRSSTTGLDDQITWNDIHHKTKQSGGPARFGYPDPNYLTRVKEELAAKGIV